MKKNMSNQEKIIIILLLVLVIVAIAAVAVMLNKSQPATEKSTPAKSKVTTPVSTTSAPVSTDFLSGIDTSDSREIEVTMSDSQSFVITVLPKVAPETVQNFVSLVESGFYDGLTFHRIIEGFMAQGGDPEGTGMGGSDATIKGEFSVNGFENPLSHQRSVVSMARSQDYNSASSQFFICYDDASYLDGQYAAFGYVSEGMEVVDSFLSAGTDSSDRPLKEVKIQTMKLR